MTEEDAYLGFSVFPGVGAGKFQLLLSHFGSVKTAWHASESELQSVLKDTLTGQFLEFRKQFSIDIYKKLLLQKNVSYMTIFDDRFPLKLKDLAKPPFILYFKGDVTLLGKDRKLIGIVGTRKVTSYGRHITENFTRDLVDSEFIIVSGLALGVDAVAHQTTVDAQGKTIAILGCGVDCCYPNSNQRLYDRIIKTGGMIISEYPLTASPNKGSFPSRNRIIAALSDGLLVTEGAEDSGSLITAEYALGLKRKVFAVPGPVTSSLSRGPLKLIHKGAHLVTSGDEICEILKIKRNTIQKRKVFLQGSTADEQKVIDSLMQESLSFDEICKNTQIDASKLAVILSFMEVKGMVRLENNVFMLKDIENFSST